MGSEGGGGWEAELRGKKERRVRTRMLNRIVLNFPSSRWRRGGAVRSPRSGRGPRGGEEAGTLPTLRAPLDGVGVGSPSAKPVWKICLEVI